MNASTVHPTVFPHHVLVKTYIVRNLTISPVGLLFAPVFTVASTLAFTVVIGRIRALNVPLHVPQDMEHLDLHRALRDGIYRLVLWLWWIIVLFAIVCSCSKLLDHGNHFCVVGCHILTELCGKYFCMFISCLLHCSTSDFLEFYLGVFQIYFKVCPRVFAAGLSFQSPRAFLKSLALLIRVRSNSICCTLNYGMFAAVTRFWSCSMSVYRVTIGSALLNLRFSTSVSLFLISSDCTFP